jgi:hypothetical protein
LAVSVHILSDAFKIPTDVNDFIEFSYVPNLLQHVREIKYRYSPVHGTGIHTHKCVGDISWENVSDTLL